MSWRCESCDGQRLNPQSRSVKLTTLDPRFAASPARTLPEVCRLPISDAIDFFSRLDLDATRS